MFSLKSFLLGESLSYKNDYVIEDNSILKYKNKYNSNSDKKYLRIATFKASGKTFYCSLIQNRFYLEPHFGVFFEGKYEQLKQAIKNNDEKTIKELMNSSFTMVKAGEHERGTNNMMEILSYVFSILSDYVKERPLSFIKIKAEKKKLKVYQKATKEAIKKKLICYHIVTEEEPSELRDKNGDQIDGMFQMILKYNFA